MDKTVAANNTGKQDESPSNNKFWKLTLGELLTTLCAAAVPIAVAIYTNNLSEQQRIADQRREFDLRQAGNLRQQQVYDKFLDDIYQLDNDDHLNEDEAPWIFANARYQAANQQLSSELKANALIFLKNKQLIGRNCGEDYHYSDRQLLDVIKLNSLNFDGIHLKSPTGDLSLLDMKCVYFEQVSLINASFSMTNLDGASFNGSNLSGVKFYRSSLKGASFEGALLTGVDFGDSSLEGMSFISIDLGKVQSIKPLIKRTTTKGKVLWKSYFLL